jgi:hypothetical protein
MLFFMMVLEMFDVHVGYPNSQITKTGTGQRNTGTAILELTSVLFLIAIFPKYSWL